MLICKKPAWEAVRLGWKNSVMKLHSWIWAFELEDELVNYKPILEFIYFEVKAE